MVKNLLLFQLVVKVKVKGFDQVIQIYAFFDNGSNVLFCLEELVGRVVKFVRREDYFIIDNFGEVNG